MDNRRLIDADKLLETLDVISQQARSIDMQELAKTIATEVRNGTFAPDPFPPTIKPGDWAIHPDLEQVRIMDAPVVHVLKGKEEYEVYLRDLEVVSHD